MSSTAQNPTSNTPITNPEHTHPLTESLRIWNTFGGWSGLTLAITHLRLTRNTAKIRRQVARLQRRQARLEQRKWKQAQRHSQLTQDLHHQQRQTSKLIAHNQQLLAIYTEPLTEEDKSDDADRG